MTKGKQIAPCGCCAAHARGREKLLDTIKRQHSINQRLKDELDRKRTAFKDLRSRFTSIRRQFLKLKQENEHAKSRT